MPAPDPRPAPAPRASAGAPATDTRPAPASRTAGPKKKPDPRPMRLVLGAGSIAAMSVMVAGLVRFPTAGPDATAADASSVEVLTAAQPEIRVERRIRYVQLKPGQKAPPGAKVIDSAAPAPRIVVTRIAARQPVTRRVVTRTRQSGRP